jgi:hypothetical protein
MLLAGLVILIAVVLVAAGRGGELSAERNDYAPLDLGPVSATDVALLRPPAAAWGYNMQATDEALARIAESIRARDVRIVALEQLVTDLGRDHTPPALSGAYPGARRRELSSGSQPPEPGGPPEAGRTAEPAPPGDASPLPEQERPADATWSAETAWSREAASPAEIAWPTPPTRPDPTIRPAEAASPQGGQPGESGRPPGEGPAVPPEQSHG